MQRKLTDSLVPAATAAKAITRQKIRDAVDQPEPIAWDRITTPSIVAVDAQVARFLLFFPAATAAKPINPRYRIAAASINAFEAIACSLYLSRRGHMRCIDIR